MGQDNGNKKELNRREVVIGRTYVFIFFFVTTVVCCLAIFLWNSDFKVFEQKEYIKVKMSRIREFQKDQSDYQMITDSIFRKIKMFEPGIHAQYEEDEINYLINNMRNVYEHNSWDKRYKVFMHVADFYDIWLVDKKQLWSIRQNINMFKSNLEECEIGLQKKMDDLRAGTKK